MNAIMTISHQPWNKGKWVGQKAWIKAIGLDPAMYGTHTMIRTKASLIYRRIKNLRAVQLLLGHTKLEARCDT